MTKHCWYSFVWGWVMHAGASMFYQDLYGLEKYIEMVRIGWIEMSPLWGLGVMLLAGGLFAKELNEVRKNNE